MFWISMYGSAAGRRIIQQEKTKKIGNKGTLKNQKLKKEAIGKLCANL